ncbi:hypothetical protein [Methylobacterium nodulans]|uniref:Uncharacterized protein n=1 Tax=Methylobacterium nodulans (strain LMG 21967 / CNCM I-2342 / ORS 2060) TaxID=460265 RepID=B8IH56_METNO|nr:hypothetical protein [Methylobacterium nodulans]ACL59748.1 hypothetical protein Mnod_4889 [Methylobacterium nodulans ORS 2060]
MVPCGTTGPIRHPRGRRAWARQTQKGTWTISPNTDLPADAAQELQGNMGESGFIRAVADTGDKELFRLINDALASTDLGSRKTLVDAAQKQLDVVR